ncbi:hypothetical protein AOB60_07345 [Streptomyces noursei]|uniref:Uncharacterized protein n=1 Tax=Streptomyces noursei TaxID=1971 RepID=A0A2N8PHX2_STRNR|nr:hypothetical protein AOB60_07345 [Streptomyces noursei]
MQQLAQQGRRDTGQAVGGREVRRLGGLRVSRGDLVPRHPHTGDERVRPAAVQRRVLVLLGIVVRALPHGVRVSSGRALWFRRAGPVLRSSDDDDGIVGPVEAGQDRTLEDDLVLRETMVALVPADGSGELVGGVA